jgi:hypothetical protein
MREGREDNERRRDGTVLKVPRQCPLVLLVEVRLVGADAMG